MVSMGLLLIHGCRHVTISLEVIIMATQNKIGYVIIQVNGKDTFEHRETWEKINGKIPDGFVIHHVNGIRSDNRIENLELIESNGLHKRKYHSSFPYEDVKPRELTDNEYNFIKDRLPLAQLGLLR
jgi:hypothetical protein